MRPCYLLRTCKRDQVEHSMQRLKPATARLYMTVHHAVPVQATLGTSSRFWEHVANLRWSKCCFLVSWVVRRCIIPPQGRSMGGNSRHNLYSYPIAPHRVSPTTRRTYATLTMAHRHLFNYVHIVVMKFIFMRAATLCICFAATPCIFFISLNPHRKRCKPHGTPSTWPPEDPEFYTSFSLADSHYYPGKNMFTNRFSQKRTRSIPALNNTAQWHWDVQGAAWQRDFHEIVARSLRDLWEIGILQGKAAGQGSKDLFYSSLLFPTLQFDSLLYSSVYSLFYSTLLFYCSLFCLSQAIEKPSSWVSISKRMFQKHAYSRIALGKSMQQTIDLSSKNDMYISWFSQRHIVCGTRRQPHNRGPWPCRSSLKLPWFRVGFRCRSLRGLNWNLTKLDKADKENASGNKIDRYQEAVRNVCLNLCRCDSTRSHWRCLPWLFKLDDSVAWKESRRELSRGKELGKRR